MAHYIKQGNVYRVADTDAMDVRDHLPAGNYIIRVTPLGEYILEQIDNFVLPKKIYGDCLKNTERVIRTFLDRPASTGVLLTGEKGSGKTLLTKNISLVLAQKHGIPTIVINQSMCGEPFNTFIQSIDQPCVIIFDEYEKVYDWEDQQKLLTLLDGVFPTKKLFLFTTNDSGRVDRHMCNRPGRIFYTLEYRGLGPDFIREYCNDNLADKQHIEKIVNITSVFNDFNFDMLKALCEEMNRYHESPQEALKLLNIRTDHDSGGSYEVEILYKGKTVKGETFFGNPLRHEEISIGFADEDDDEDVVKASDSSEESLAFKITDLVSIDANAGKFVFKNNFSKATLTRVKTKQYEFYQAF